MDRLVTACVVVALPGVAAQDFFHGDNSTLAGERQLSQTSDGLCSAGLIKGQVCCDAACGMCGGQGCSKLPGGASKCCPGTIQSSARACSGPTDTACMMQEAQRSGLKEWCEEGVANNGVCCPKTCGQCGGVGCGSAPGGKDQCCSSEVLKANTACKSMNDVACVVPQNVRPIECAANQMCSDQGLPGNCCPADSGQSLTCCHQVIDGKTESDNEAADWCHKGIKKLSGMVDGIYAERVCCAKECGTCGGSGCSGFPGGATKCCPSGIQKSGDWCKTLDDVGCWIPLTQPPECSAHPECAKIGLQGLCCPHESGNNLGCCPQSTFMTM